MTDKMTQTKAKVKAKVSRRRFIKGSSLTVLGVATAFGAVSPWGLKARTVRLRPPGALDEGLFLSSCIKCGQCLQVCPPQILMLDSLANGFSVGTPYLIPREGGCILCSGLPCILACPTGALAQDITLGKEAHMGLAVLSNPADCLALKGENDLLWRIGRMGELSAASRELKLTDLFERLIERLNEAGKKALADEFGIETPLTKEHAPLFLAQNIEAKVDWLAQLAIKSGLANQPCTICLDDCPIKSERPIEFKEQVTSECKRALLPVVQRSCVGCGICEEKCPTVEAAITIVPRLKWQSA